MKINMFSEKQEAVLGWWTDKSKYKSYDAIICDGAVRSGKTFVLTLSFFIWAMHSFDKQNFAIAGKTISSTERNVIAPILPDFKKIGMNATYTRTRGYIEVRSGKKINKFYIFGGKDESSAALIQGITLAGMLFDEVALMPKSFVEQAVARCSIDGSKFWFNCNPENPHHYFYKEWILKLKSKRAFRLHFLMDDNPSLSPRTKERYERLYSGVFYDRFVKGLWVAAEGLVYTMFDNKEGGKHVKKPSALPAKELIKDWYISIDYGSRNPFSAGLWGYDGLADIYYRYKEYYYSGRDEGIILTDGQYADAIDELSLYISKVYDPYINSYKKPEIVIDPSAVSMAQELRNREYHVIQANNAVEDGIRTVAHFLIEEKIVISSECKDAIREFGMYRYDNKILTKDAVIKENDHAMDDIRYFVYTIANKDRMYEAFFAIGKDRR